MKFAVLDFETTGGQPADEIIQVGLVIIDDEQIIDRYASLVKPTISIPPFITSLTGITDEEVADAPPLEEAVMQMQHMLKDCVLVGHNVAFDLGFLQRALDSCGYFPFGGMVLDTMDMLRMVFPSLTSLQLANVSESLGITLDRHHRADADAEATAEIWLRCLKRLQEFPLLTVQRLAAVFDEDSSDLSWFIKDQCARKEQSPPPETDSHHYYRQYAMNVDEWGNEPELRPDPKEKEALNVPFDDFYQEVKDRLQHKFQVYENREAQDRMIREVAASFEDDTHLMIEAGTGTGKSLGYLIPSLYYGINQGKKVLVSTHTINLQEQLRIRDLPLLHDIFPVSFRASVLKGRSHYLCLRKFEQKITYSEYDHPREDLITAAQMIVWLSQTEHGDEEELHFGNKGQDFWRTVESDADSCLNRNCPWFKRCFYHRAKNDANGSDVVITNHSLLFTDIKAENRLLPSYKHLIIDEAHHFEEVASRHLGTEIQFFSVINTLSWLAKDSKIGQLSMLRGKLVRSEDLHEDTVTRWCGTIDEIYPQIIEIREQWETLCSLLFEVLVSGSDGSAGENGQLVMRIREEKLPPGWSRYVEMEDRLFGIWSEMLRKLDKLVTELKDVQEVLDLQSQVTDLGGTVKDLHRLQKDLRAFMKREDSNFVYWMEASAFHKMKSLQLISLPTDVSPMLQEYFFDAKDSIVMTSATLSVDKKFNYTVDQLGLQEKQSNERLRTVLLPSPFDYRKQALVCIPRDFPGIKGAGGEEKFVEALIDSLAEVAKTTQGRMLILFTSYRMLKLVYPELKEHLSGSDIQVLGQGIDSGNRTKLIRLFQGPGTNVLLGTSSFWEGVDIPGEALSCLAIVRLPFQPPTHPVVEAKCDELKKNNQNPFIKLSVPQAVIRFKQGFGRLVRTARDRGIVIIYDTRVIDTHYGKYFLYSLPGPKIEHMKTTQLVPRIVDWMEGEQEPI